MDDYDDGDYLDMDGDWIYVDDEYDLADELAENAIPEPGYMGTAAEIAMEDYDFDLYGYNEDLEYGEDPYWDTSGLRPAPLHRRQAIRAVEMGKAGSKRKRDAGETFPSKRQKSAPAGRESQPVIFRSRTARNAAEKHKAPAVQARESFALLPDWRERFKDTDGIVCRKHMPAAMAQAVYEAVPEKEGREDGEGEDEGEDEDGDEDAGSSWESDDEGEEGALDIDPDKLRTILAAKLAEAGISGDEEGAFLKSINEMLSGEGKGETAAALLEKAGSSDSRKRKADSAVGLEPEQKKGRDGRASK